MSAYFYSPELNAFFAVELEDDYRAAGTWPNDGIYITEEEYRDLMLGQNEGQVVAPDENGRPVLTEPDINWQERAETARQKLLSEANNVTADWRVELMLGAITDQDKARLTAWMAYIRELKALDLIGVTDEEGLTAITWPDKPE
ncbi:phage tail protein [Cronobacter sakazakii]|uniref:tail fiber assembly protein n=1 Tax=Cronobacter sakazakii TaxID=28141 RepID=UPI000CFD9CA3|nr:tail fiber assembly protein [Cronobacter sakazakii]ELY6363700.1 tail fiber assembly protein [Cronobacter sakazakii]PQX60509.1 phage tail protein [Cronobacter sakazakii]PQY01835.1 phage tail protein [Cronobacter sakazakii]